MRWFNITLMLLMMAFMTTLKAEPLELGAPAPAFELKDQHGNSHTVEDYQGKWLVLYFYPKDDTPGCTTEACAFRDEYKVITALNTQVIGVSVDDQQSHADFAEKYNLPFPLLSDEDGLIADKYGALASLGPIKFAKRHTIIIGPQGQIRKVYRSVNASRHSQEVIADLQTLRAEQTAL